MTIETRREYTVSSLNTTPQERLRFVLDHLAQNQAYRRLPEDQKTPAALRRFKGRYRAYRENWRALPEQAIATGRRAGGVDRLDHMPLCVDIETAAICDLACPFCYRQHIATPDRLMKKELFRQVIDQCAAMNVPSIKLNWRGEPLLHPALAEFVDYAKRKGILDVLINTNATRLDRDTAGRLLDAGIDGIIYSFDGGTPETYNRLRPGRFKPNTFDTVYGHIEAFARLRQARRQAFPVTRIQMIITRATAGEVDAFHDLFAGVVDDVSTKAYSERGGDLGQIEPQVRRAVESHFASQDTPPEAIDPNRIWTTSTGDIFYATGRLACQQLFQRLVVTYDGRVHMCCYDWAGAHTIGFLAEQAFDQTKKDVQTVMNKARRAARGYEGLSDVAAPHPEFEPARRITPLADIWNSDHLNRIRSKHVTGRIDALPLCRNCNFRDTYTWIKISGANR